MSTPQCSAITKALNNKGYDTAKLASQVGTSKQHVDDILSGKTKPTQQEFGSIAKALDLSNPPAHAAKVAV